MAYLKEKSEVKSMIPAEIAKSLREELSLDIKDASPEERQARILRRELICKSLGISAKNIDQFLKDMDNHIEKASENPLDNNPYIDGQNKESKNRKRKTADSAFSFGLSVISSIIPELKIISFVYNGIKILVDSKKDVGFENGEPDSQTKLEALQTFMEKVAILNDKINENIDELLKNKKSMNSKDFNAYKKNLIAKIREDMKTYGVEIDASKKLDTTTPDSEQSEPGA